MNSEVEICLIDCQTGRKFENLRYLEREKRFSEQSVNYYNERHFRLRFGAAPSLNIWNYRKNKDKKLEHFAKKTARGGNGVILCEAFKKIFCDKIFNATIH